MNFSNTAVALIALGGFMAGCVTNKELGDIPGEADSGSGTSPGTGSESESAGMTSGASATSTSGPSGVTSSPPTDSSTTDTVTTSPGAESSTGSECEKTDCAQCAPPLLNAQYCIDGEVICACEFQRPCEVVEVACAYLELDPAANDNAVDCGIATLADPLSVWEMVTACVQDSEMNQIAFKGAFELQGDSPMFAGFIGLTGAVYQVKELLADTPGLGNRVDVRDCNGLAQFACPIEVGELCVACDSQDEFTNVCQENPESP